MLTCRTCNLEFNDFSKFCSQCGGKFVPENKTFTPPPIFTSPVIDTKKDDLYQKIERAYKLLEQGAISQSEFDKLKAGIIGVDVKTGPVLKELESRSPEVQPIKNSDVSADIKRIIDASQNYLMNFKGFYFGAAMSERVEFYGIRLNKNEIPLFFYEKSFFGLNSSGFLLSDLRLHISPSQNALQSCTYNEISSIKRVNSDLSVHTKSHGIINLAFNLTAVAERLEKLITEIKNLH